LDVIDVIFSNPYWSILAAALTIGGLIGIGYGAGKHYTKNSWERRLEQERMRQEELSAEYYGKEKVKTHFRTKLEWIEERKSDLNVKIASRGTSEQERDIYRKLIDELDVQKRELERSRDSLLD
jgi:hypothetical protein